MTVKGPFEGMEVRDGWIVPTFDQICFPSVVQELQKFPEVLKHTPKRRTVIQAGGNLGIFPRELANHFEYVYTFEPDTANFAAMCANLIDKPNVITHFEGLGEKLGVGSVKQVDPSNIGAHYVDFGSGNVHIATIDEYTSELMEVDLIWLDIEGGEYFALRGGVETIKRCKPTIVLEMAGHSERFYGVPESETESWLAKLGYQPTAKVMNDVIYTYRE